MSETRGTMYSDHLQYTIAELEQVDHAQMAIGAHSAAGSGLTSGDGLCTSMSQQISPAATV